MRRALLLSAVLSGTAVAPAAMAEPPPRWVFFSDKELGASVEHALAARAAELAPRALARRKRARGDRGVDLRDLAPAPRHVAAVEAAGARVRVSSRWLNAVSVVADARELAAIAALPMVTRIAPVARRRRLRPPRLGPATPHGGPNGMYGVALDQLAMLDVPAMHDCGLSGDGVVVALLDSGFVLDHEALSHLDVLAQHDFIQDDGDTSDGPEDVPGQHDHGTAVLSLLAGRALGSFMGVAPDATVLLAKTEDISLEQPIEEDWFVAGLEWAESLGADVVTASLGYIDWYGPEDLDGQTAVTTLAANVAMQNGVVMLAAAGNWGPDPISIGAPADADPLVAVGAVDLAGMVTDFSSRGPTFDGRIKPDVAALGQDDWVVVPGTLDEYAQGNGTSYATPLVAGVAALLKQAYPDLTPAEMHALLTTTASQAATPDNDMGYGIVQGYDAAGLFCTCHDLDDDDFFDVACGGDDCDDEAASVHPAAEEQCNGLDDDCDGALGEGEGDADGDGFLACADDCDDGDPDVSPAGLETCGDGIDADCDGTDTACPLPPPPPEPGPVEDPSCGCRLPAESDGAGVLAWLALALALAARRRRSAAISSARSSGRSRRRRRPARAR